MSIFQLFPSDCITLYNTYNNWCCPWWIQIYAPESHVHFKNLNPCLWLFGQPFSLIVFALNIHKKYTTIFLWLKLFRIKRISAFSSNDIDIKSNQKITIRIAGFYILINVHCSANPNSTSCDTCIVAFNKVVSISELE